MTGGGEEFHLLDRRASFSILVLFCDLSELDRSMLLRARRMCYWYIGDLIVNPSIADNQSNFTHNRISAN